MIIELAKLFFEVLNTFLVFVSTLTVIVTAILGYNAWKKEFSGKRKIELAEEVLALFYEARNAIRTIRGRVSYSNEGSTESHLNEPPAVQVFYERYEKRQEVFNKLSSKRYQFKARMGTEKPFEELKKIMDDMWIAARTLIRISEYYGNNDEKVRDEKRKSELFILSSSTDDPITTRMDKVISDIEEICRPIILGKK